MAQKERTSLIRRMRFKYRVSFIDEKVEEEVAYCYVSRLGVICWGIVTVLFLLLVGMLLVVVTPLHRHLPGYTDMTFREQLIRNTLRTDSLYRVVELQNAYLLNLRQVISGEIPVDTACLNDSVLKRPKEKLLPVSEEEQHFRKWYSEEEKRKDEHGE